jgi:hypothetical protein
VTASETARLDLYNALVDLLGETKAGTLMTHLPTYDPVSVVTRDDLADLIARFDARFDQIDARLERFEARLDGFDRRLDRLFLTLVAGLFVVVAAMAGVVASSLG